jgi:hypothetical protein
MNGTSRSLVDERPCDGPHALDSLRRGSRRNVRIAVMALYCSVHCLFILGEGSFAFIFFSVFLFTASFALLRSSIWWKLEPGRESLYWLCAAWVELLILIAIIIIAIH